MTGGLPPSRNVARCPPRRPRSRPRPAPACCGRARHALRAEQLRDELAEDDRLAVGDEVDAAGAPALGAQHQALDDVVDVRRRGAVAPAADPGEAPLLDRLHEARQDRRVARAPHQPRPHDDRLEAVAVRVAHRLLGLRLRRGVESRRVGPQRSVLVRRSRAARPPAARPRCRRARSAARPRPAMPRARCACRSTLPRSNSSRRAPLAEVRGGVEGDVGALGAGAHAPRRRRGRRGPARRRAPDTFSADASERASARTFQPSPTRRRISRPPMKPEPPVTNAVRLGLAHQGVSLPASRRPAVPACSRRRRRS